FLPSFTAAPHASDGVVRSSELDGSDRNGEPLLVAKATSVDLVLARLVANHTLRSAQRASRARDVATFFAEGLGDQTPFEIGDGLTQRKLPRRGDLAGLQVLRKMLFADDRAVAHHHRAFDHVFELADVAR